MESLLIGSWVTRYVYIYIKCKKDTCHECKTIHRFEVRQVNGTQISFFFASLCLDYVIATYFLDS